jgi:hypothetical protein
MNFDLCTLSFDEVKIAETIVYDSRADAILGPHRQAQVAIIRGLLYPYKQPIFIDFDQKMTKDILFALILSLHKIDFKVVCIVSDMGPTNVGLWRQLGITDSVPHFKSPCKASERIFVFPDAPHLLKLCRNHLLDKGYVLPTGMIVLRSDLEEILSSDNGVYKIHPKLKSNLFTCQGSERQRVCWAAQLLSNHTAAALQFLFPEKVEQALFVKLVNDWFDVANSRSKNDGNNLKSGYGIHMSEQETVVNKTIELMSKTFQIGRNSLLPFQHGMIQWCYALKGLYQNVRIKYNVQWLMTSRLNSDHVENFFSQIRGLGGGYNHPGPVEILNRTRLLMITHSETTAKFTIEKAPVQFSDDAADDHHFVTAGVASSVRLIASEPVPDELFEPFSTENETDENNNSSDTDLVSTSEPDCSEQGQIYFAGYLAHCFREKFPNLGSPSAHLNISDIPPWMSVISRGGLICPTDNFLGQVKQLEKHFLSFHGDNLSKTKNVMKKLYEQICKDEPSVPACIVRKYVRCRTFFRIKYENQKLVQMKSEKLQHSRNARKMKHFTT